MLRLSGARDVHKSPSIEEWTGAQPLSTIVNKRGDLSVRGLNSIVRPHNPHTYMDLFGSHRISLESIRRLAIECHALDSAAVRLLIDTTIDNPHRVRTTYEEIFSEKLLSLAVSLRTKFYQGIASQGTERYVLHSAFLLVTDREEIQTFTIKDVCDKIIHADSITRPLADGTAQPITQVRGIHQGTPWTLHVSSSLFCEGVLNWIDSLESSPQDSH